MGILSRKFTKGFAALALSAMCFTQATAQTFYPPDREEDVTAEALPGILLAGGASDNDDAMRWFLERAGGGDVVVIRAAGSGTYNNYLYSSLGVPINSVTTIVIPDRTAANNQEVYDVMTKAEALFIAGGNQWNYINHWKNTLVHEALDYLIHEKKITVGGTSAGLAVLGEVVYSAQNNTVWSSEALGNPYHFRVTLENEFLNIPFLEHVVTDSHYNREESDGMTREGRHVAFMARMVTDWGMPARGIGINEYTAVGVDENGLARVFGDPDHEDLAYFIDSRGKVPEVCVDGEPLTWDHDGEALLVYQVPGNQEGSHTFDLASWDTGQGGTWSHWYVREGTLFFGPTVGTTDLVFRVLQGIHEAPLEAALVSLENYGQKHTDPEGMAVFSDVEPGETLSYQVSLQGFLGETGMLTTGNESVTLTVFLYPGDATPTGSVPGAETPVRLGPNPASGRFFLEAGPTTQILHFHLVDAHGSQVFWQTPGPEGPGRHWYDVPDLSPGLYMVVAITATARHSLPLLLLK
jgi:cyanophycinase-like exopeptidase